ncbi:MAG: N-methyl-L-tryptophan oxidase [Alicyclobacillus macrosporangiidus]|uniref:N-methyl-L-tryptophan oxidase n=1 Tax=Alicyclobacillus macrosporangiidus TaxID=392015 RepID=UPI0026F01C99|nr:N-methyl-L-tryptophan oxidase [Alicyclobacillus macrosporangiidus]MCL6597712.1 N-methyl-L-tryptophan oxidase [Alicyclobacillus macrosporangiidus]
MTQRAEESWTMGVNSDACSRFDTVILGAGSMGLATAYALSRRGHSVALLDRHIPPHTLGSHHGETRLFRMAYAEGAAYIPLLQDARRMWLELEAHASEAESGQGAVQLFAQTGVLNAARPGANLLRGVRESLNRYRIPHQWLTAAEAAKRWPGLSLPDDYEVLFDPLGGVLFSERCLAALKAAALGQGATLLIGGPVRELQVQPGEVVLEWGGHRVVAASLVITLGAGAGPFLTRWFPEWRIPVQPIRKTVAWFRGSHRTSSGAPYYSADAFPGYLVETKGGTFYGFPDFGEGVKVGRHDGGEPCDMESVNRDFHAYPQDEQVLRGFLGRFLPYATEFQRGSVCLYTMTPDEHFVVDSHPEHAHVVVGAGFSGHGFKFASVIGDVLARMVEQEEIPYDLSLFRASRWTSDDT